MEHIFQTKLLDCYFNDDGKSLYTLLGLTMPDFDNDPTAEGLEVDIEVTIDVDLEYNDGRGWETDGCPEGTVACTNESTIECIYKDKRYNVESILSKNEIDSLIENAEKSAITCAEKDDSDVDYEY